MALTPRFFCPQISPPEAPAPGSETHAEPIRHNKSPTTRPDFRSESEALAAGCPRVAGVDEVGRGPLAGPVTAAAVCLDPANVPTGLDDSKRLSPARRADLFVTILATADVSVAHASVEEIEQFNILAASYLAMRRAVEGLPRRPGLALIDGPFVPRGLACPARAIPGGDRLSASIAAASIVAKVIRDRLMVDLAQQHPGYGWERNAGYPTREHRAALLQLGITAAHRRTFAPVHNILYQENSLTL